IRRRQPPSSKALRRESNWRTRKNPQSQPEAGQAILLLLPKANDARQILNMDGICRNESKRWGQKDWEGIKNCLYFWLHLLDLAVLYFPTRKKRCRSVKLTVWPGAGVAIWIASEEN